MIDYTKPENRPAYFSEQIIKQGTRILMPCQWEAMRQVMIPARSTEVLAEAITRGDTQKSNKIQRYQIICDAMLMTGMRYVEFNDLARSWYSGPRRVINIPKGGKKKCLYTERTVMLSLPACDAVERYLASGLKPPHRVSMREALRAYATKAGIGEDGICPKMFRKTWESWLMAWGPERVLYIAASMGHTVDVMQKHYLGLGFPKEEIDTIGSRYAVQWGGGFDGK